MSVCTNRSINSSFFSPVNMCNWLFCILFQYYQLLFYIYIYINKIKRLLTSHLRTCNLNISNKTVIPLRSGDLLIFYEYSEISVIFHKFCLLIHPCNDKLSKRSQLSLMFFNRENKPFCLRKYSECRKSSIFCILCHLNLIYLPLCHRAIIPYMNTSCQMLF